MQMVETQIERGRAARAAVSVAPPLCGGGLIRLRAYRRKRTLAQPIGIVLAVLGHCDNSLGDDLFGDMWLSAPTVSDANDRRLVGTDLGELDRPRCRWRPRSFRVETQRAITSRAE